MAHSRAAACTSGVPNTGWWPDGRIHVWEALALLGRGRRIAFVDARCTRDWMNAREKLPGAIRLAPDRADETLPLIPPGYIAVVYCASPGQTSSSLAARVLRSSGYLDVRVLEGGLGAWRGAGGPLEPA